MRLVQNPALGAVILWRFARKYSDSHALHSAVPLPLCALVLPMVWHQETADQIAATREASGLRAFTAKFSDTKNSQLDALLALQRRAARWREKTLGALHLGFGSNLLRLDEKGGLLASDEVWAPARQPQTVRNQTNAAEKLGAWFATMTLREISVTLRVRF